MATTDTIGIHWTIGFLRKEVNGPFKSNQMHLKATFCMVSGKSDVICWGAGQHISEAYINIV